MKFGKNILVVDIVFIGLLVGSELEVGVHFLNDPKITENVENHTALR